MYEVVLDLFSLSYYPFSILTLYPMSLIRGCGKQIYRTIIYVVNVHGLKPNFTLLSFEEDYEQ